jgi:L-alanine-DL-glutamate epimerase-like enolase superfamily enzyme
MIKFRCFIQKLEIKGTFRTAHGSRKEIESIWVELSGSNLKAYGEAVPVPYYRSTAQEVKNALDNLQNLVEYSEIDDASAFWEKTYPYLNNQPAAQCALDIAVYDYLSQKAQKPLYQYLGLAWREDLPVSNYTISLGTAEQMLAQMQAMPYPIYKIKLGSENDLEILKMLQKYPSTTFRIDANCAWTLEQARNYLPELEKMQIEFIEQPFAVGEWQSVEEFRKITNIPILADESCRTEADLEKCKNYFSGVNIKLAKCGGITPALRMIEKAKKYNLKVMMGCMTESSIGITAIAHLLPLLDFVDMDGALLLANNPAKGVRLEKGKAILPSKNGLGVEIDS